MAFRDLEKYIHCSAKRLIQAPKDDKIDTLETNSILNRKKEKARLQNWKGKVLHGQYLRQAEEVRNDKSRVCIRNRNLKRKRGTSIIAAQPEYMSKLHEIKD